MRIWAKILAGLGVVLAAGLVVAAQAYPSVAATACPGCYELTEAQPGVYLEDGLSAEQRGQIGQAVEQARQRVSAFYGSRVSSPRMLVCLSDTCYRRIGGGKERGIAVLDRAVMLSPRGVDPVIASHEMSHVELHARLRSGAEVPQWFDEGLAVVVSDDRRYLAAAGSPDRCLVRTAEPLPATLSGWLRAAGADQQTYAKAACRTDEWLSAHGGRAGLFRLIDRLNAGEPFNQAAS